MDGGAIQRAGPGDLAELQQLQEQATEYLGQAKSANTLRAYRADWADFTAWCESAGASSLPAAPETLALYLTARAETHTVSTLQRRLAAISQAHQARDLETPTKHLLVRSVWAGIRRVRGTAQQGKAAAVTEDLRLMVERLPLTLIGIRDRALLLVGFAGAFRRSELVSLNRADVTVGRDGVTVHLRRSKTDQEGAGTTKGIPYGSNPDTCPVRSLREWLSRTGIKSGPLFRPVDRHGRLGEGRLSDRAVALIVKRCAAAAGLKAADYSGHSLRAGLATSAAAAGVSERAIMKQTGHKSERMVRKYIREGSLWRDNAAGRVGL
ncbi:MAG TPA: tyrosine-type recombinase/integrase [Armatimonadota bacterium]|nr:tyrosine-type recombinase/integrase [Armatimonadota bacterium]